MPLPDPHQPKTRPGTLWMYMMPGLSSELLEEVAREMGLMWNGQLVNLHPTQWVEYQDRCRDRLKLPLDWMDAMYREARSMAIDTGWGKRFGPGSPGGWRRKEKNEYVESVATRERLDLEGTLFEANASRVSPESPD